MSKEKLFSLIIDVLFHDGSRETIETPQMLKRENALALMNEIMTKMEVDEMPILVDDEIIIAINPKYIELMKISIKEYELNMIGGFESVSE